MHRIGALVAIGWLVACGGSSEDEVDAPPPEPIVCATGDTKGPTGTCCPPATLPKEDGSCRAAGIAACGEGFVATEGGGCEPVLPAMPCAPGLMAVPGDGACRAIMDCGSGPWGNIEVDANTQYVDARYDGGASDGSATRPWTSIQAGIDAAGPGAVVAVAAGLYGEDIGVFNAVRVRGRCPYLVTVVGQGLPNAIGIYAGGVEIGGLAITGPNIGVAVFAASDVKLDGLWVNDTASRGIEIAGPASATVSDSLIESAHEIGAIAFSADVAFERSVVRDIQFAEGFGVGVWLNRIPNSSTPSRGTLHRSLVERTIGHGLIVQESSLTMQSSVLRDVAPKHTTNIYGRGIEIAKGSELVLTQSLIERTHDDGVLVSTSHASIENAVVRDIEPQASDGLLGVGLSVQSDMAGNRSSATVAHSLFERTHLAGMVSFGSDLDAESVIARDILPGSLPLGPDADVGFGAGMMLQDDPNLLRARGSLRGALVENCTAQSLAVLGADLRLEATKVVGGLPSEDGRHGQGLVVRNNLFTRQRGFAEVVGGAFEANLSAAVAVHESDAVLDNVAIRDTVPRVLDGTEGFGITVQRTDPTYDPSQVTLRRSLIERITGIGVFAYSSHIVIESSRVRDVSVQPVTGLYGDGVAAADGATVRIQGNVIERSVRAGVVSFGAAVTLGNTTLECNSIQLAMQSFLTQPASFTDDGGNHCGCGELQDACRTLSSALEPPQPLE